MVIRKKLLRNGWANNLRFIGSIMIIAVCVCMYSSFASSMWSLFYNLDEYREANNLHSYILSTYTKLNNMDEMEKKFDIQMEQRWMAEVKDANEKTVRLLSANREIDTYSVTAGSDLTDENTILLDELFAGRNGYDIGSTITLAGTDFTVNGYFTEPDLVLITNSEKNITVNHEFYGIGVISKEKADTIPQMTYEYLICSDGDLDADEFLKEAYMNGCSIKKFLHVDSDNRASYIDGDLMIYTKGMQVIPFFFLIVASISVAIILNKLMKAETLQIGILYSLGYKPFDLFKHYISYAIVISLMGSVLGIGLGMLVAPFLKALVTDRYSVPDFTIQLSVKIVAVSLIVPFLLLVSFSSVFIMIKLNESPLSLLRNSSVAKGKGGFRSLHFGKIPFVHKFRIREILRNFPRMIFLVFGVCISSVMLLMFASILSSLNKVMEDSFSTIFRYQYMYSFRDMQTGTPDGYRTNLNYLLLDGDEVSVNGIDVNNPHMCFDDTDGNPVTFEKNGITINLARQHDISVGDTITLTNRYSGETWDLEIECIIVSYVEDFVSMPLDEFNETFGYPKDSYVLLTTDEEQDIDEEILIFKNNVDDSYASIDETMFPVRCMMVIMMVMAGVVSFVLLTIVISIIVEDNKFSIALMKIFGYTEKRISLLLIDFNRYVVLLAFGLSIPMTLGCSDGVISYLSSMMNMYIPAYLEPLHAVIGFILLYIIYAVVKTIMKKSIFEIDQTEILKGGD